MVMQRCVWSCLANNPPATNPAYHACVDRACTPENLYGRPAPSDWLSGTATDGVHRFAMTQAEQGMAFTYFCMPGQSYFVLGGVPVPPGQYRMLIGQTDYIVTLDMSRGVLSATIPPDNVFMTAVRNGGDWLTIREMQGAYLLRFSLRGADTHIAQALAGCAG